MTNTPSNTSRHTQALDLWKSGTHQAGGTNATRQSIRENNLLPATHILAIGKAAPAMARGAIAEFGDTATVLVVTKYDHSLPELAQNPRVTTLESAHPIPDQNTLAAGAAALDFVSGLAGTDRLLLLVSGGASSLVEVLAPGVDLQTLVALNQRMISAEHTIDEINAARRKLSRIKSGGLLSNFKGARVDVIMISDVLNDDPNVIGSGIGMAIPDPKSTYSMGSFLAANNASARQAVADTAASQGLAIVENREILYGEISELAPQLAQRLRSGPAGVYIWGGEPVVSLPDNPGDGGRNQALALLLAREIQGDDRFVIVCGGTDGTDGPTEAAGGIVDGATYAPERGHDAAILGANTGPALRAAGALLVTGPTGTNVMDIVVAIKTATS